MIIDFRKSNTPSALETDICIIGAGAAGLTLASQLNGLCRVLVVEAGDRHPPKQRDDALIGESDTPFAGFEAGRRRALGGATRGWFGQCLRLDPIDFAPRAWVPHSGWPFGIDTLAPFYDRAEHMLGLGQPTYDSQMWRSAGRPIAAFDGTDVTPRFTVYCRQPDFSESLGRQIARAASTATVVLNAAACELTLAENGRFVRDLQLRSSNGRQGVVRAQTFVLAGGGIENPRLLLTSNRQQAAGIGNAHDLVGRFFQDHPSGTTGVLSIAQPHRLQDLFRKFYSAGLLVWPKLALSEAAQLRGQYLNANALMLYDYAPTSALSVAKRAASAAQARRLGALAHASARLLAHVPELAVRAVHSWTTGLAPMFAPSGVMLKTHVEQMPDPQNRITLSDARDALGVPRARLTWRVHQDELRTLRAMTEAVGMAFDRLGFGAIAVADWVDQDPATAQAYLEDTFHHAGTTRMANSAAQGVVDPQCRVFGVENLYVAGGSVFPTSGYANPTLTIMALAIRLSDHLKARHGAHGSEVVPGAAPVSPQLSHA
jgi:choline dehydrogenase-like flavoprotein